MESDEEQHTKYEETPLQARHGGVAPACRWALDRGTVREESDLTCLEEAVAMPMKHVFFYLF